MQDHPRQTHPKYIKVVLMFTQSMTLKYMYGEQVEMLVIINEHCHEINHITHVKAERAY